MNTKGMIMLEINSRPKCVHVCVNNDEHEGDDQVEDQPDVHHLDVSSHWQVRIHLKWAWKNYCIKE